MTEMKVGWGENCVVIQSLYHDTKAGLAWGKLYLKATIVS